MNGYDECIDNFYAFAAAILTELSVDKALEVIGIDSREISTYNTSEKTERNAQLIQDRQNGASIKELMAKYGITYSCVFRVLNNGGIYMVKSRKGWD